MLKRDTNCSPFIVKYGAKKQKFSAAYKRQQRKLSSPIYKSQTILYSTGNKQRWKLFSAVQTKNGKKCSVGTLAITK